MNGIHSLELGNDLPGNKQIEALTFDAQIFVRHHNRFLSFKGDFPQRELVAERILIDPFEKAGPEMCMHLKTGVEQGFAPAFGFLGKRRISCFTIACSYSTTKDTKSTKVLCFFLSVLCVLCGKNLNH